MKKKLMFDPTPAGWAYGFPRALPDDAVIHYGGEWDYGIKKEFNLTEWVCSFGYPEKSFQYYKVWVEEGDNNDQQGTGRNSKGKTRGTASKNRRWAKSLSE